MNKHVLGESKRHILKNAIFKHVCIIFLWSPFLIKSQDSLKSTFINDLNKKTFAAFPVAFYSPETKIGIGAGGVYAFPFNSKDTISRPSNIQFGLVYTQLRQVLVYLPYQLFIKQNKFSVYGELGYYVYYFRYFGVGSDSKKEDDEFYGAQLPRFRFSGLYNFTKYWYVGIKYTFDNYTITQVKELGLLWQKNVVGYSGGTISGLGLVFNIDSRDNVFFPSSGFYSEFYYQPFLQSLGSHYVYTKNKVEASYYFQSKRSYILAVNTRLDYTTRCALF